MQAKSNDAYQIRLHTYYFWFQFVFVLLAATHGQNSNGFVEFIGTLLDTDHIFDWLAHTLPSSSHFFLNFMVLQCTTHCLNLVRYIQVLKYLSFKRLYPEETARRMAEPEDQDFYGKGARAARWTINLLVGLVFGTLCPLMYLVVLLNFWVQRNVVHGWLLPFAETKKADSGGYFWVKMCRHVYCGLVLYWALMVGVLAARAGQPQPKWIAGFAVFYLGQSFYNFEVRYTWVLLPYSEIKRNCRVQHTFPHVKTGTYEQPEMIASLTATMY